MSNSRGLAPSAGPTIPIASMVSMSRPARVYPIRNLLWMADTEARLVSSIHSATSSSSSSLGSSPVLFTEISGMDKSIGSYTIGSLSCIADSVFT